MNLLEALIGLGLLMGVIGTAAVVLEHDADSARAEHFRDDWLALHDAVAEYQRRWPLDAPVAWFEHGAPDAATVPAPRCTADLPCLDADHFDLLEPALRDRFRDSGQINRRRIGATPFSAERPYAIRWAATAAEPMALAFAVVDGAGDARAAMRHLTGLPIDVIHVGRDAIGILPTDGPADEYRFEYRILPTNKSLLAAGTKGIGSDVTYNATTTGVVMREQLLDRRLAFAADQVMSESVFSTTTPVTIGNACTVNAMTVLPSGELAFCRESGTPPTRQWATFSTGVATAPTCSADRTLKGTSPADWRCECNASWPASASQALKDSGLCPAVDATATASGGDYVCSELAWGGTLYLDLGPKVPARKETETDEERAERESAEAILARHNSERIDEYPMSMAQTPIRVICARKTGLECPHPLVAATDGSASCHEGTTADKVIKVTSQGIEDNKVDFAWFKWVADGDMAGPRPVNTQHMCPLTRGHGGYVPLSGERRPAWEWKTSGFPKTKKCIDDGSWFKYYGTHSNNLANSEPICTNVQGSTLVYGSATQTLSVGSYPAHVEVDVAANQGRYSAHRFVGASLWRDGNATADGGWTERIDTFRGCGRTGTPNGPLLALAGDGSRCTTRKLSLMKAAHTTAKCPDPAPAKRTTVGERCPFEDANGNPHTAVGNSITYRYTKGKPALQVTNRKVDLSFHQASQRWLPPRVGEAGTVEEEVVDPPCGVDGFDCSEGGAACEDNYIDAPSTKYGCWDEDGFEILDRYGRAIEDGRECTRAGGTIGSGATYICVNNPAYTPCSSVAQPPVWPYNSYWPDSYHVARSAVRHYERGGANQLLDFGPGVVADDMTQAWTAKVDCCETASPSVKKCTVGAPTEDGACTMELAGFGECDRCLGDSGTSDAESCSVGTRHHCGFNPTTTTAGTSLYRRFQITAITTEVGCAAVGAQWRSPPGECWRDETPVIEAPMLVGVSAGELNAMIQSQEHCEALASGVWNDVASKCSGYANTVACTALGGTWRTADSECIIRRSQWAGM